MYTDYLFHNDLGDEYARIMSVDYDGDSAIVQLDNEDWTTWYPVEESLIESMAVAGYNLVSYSGDRLDIKIMLSDKGGESDLHDACVYNDTWRAMSANPEDY